MTDGSTAAESWQGGPRWLLVVGALLGWVDSRPSSAAEEGCGVVVSTIAGPSVEGRLESIGAEDVVVATDSGTRRLAISDLRRLDCQSVGVVADQAHSVRVQLTDGSHLLGDALVSEGGLASVESPAGPISMPTQRLAWVAWSRPANAPELGGPPPWLAAVPRAAGADLVVIARDEKIEFVECAIAGIEAENVQVILEGEKIPVRIEKILGLVWLRPTASENSPPTTALVTVQGGILRAASLEWSRERFAVRLPESSTSVERSAGEGREHIDVVQLPPSLLVAVDYAAGRQISLAVLPTERLDVEPFFGELLRLEAIAGFFKPRLVDHEWRGLDAEAAEGGGTPPSLLLRPRTQISWRLPSDARRLTGEFVGLPPAVASSVVVLEADDREVFRGVVEAERLVPIAIDVVGVRRLRLTVDFPGAAPGKAGMLSGPVLLKMPVIER